MGADDFQIIGVKAKVAGLGRVGQQDQLAQAHGGQDLRAKAGVLHRARAFLFLHHQRGARVAEKADRPPALLGNDLHRAGQFAHRRRAKAQNVLKLMQRMGAHQNRLGRGDVTLGQHDMLDPFGHIGEDAHGPGAAIGRGDLRAAAFAHEVVVAAAIGDEVGNGADLQLVLAGEFHQFGQPRHGAVVIHDLADHARRVQARKAADIGRGLGMTGADQDAAVARAQREDMARRCDVLRPAFRVDGNGDGQRPVLRGNAGRHAFARLDRDGKGGFVARGTGHRHHRQAQRVDPFARQRQADQATAMSRHEVDRLRRRMFGRDAEVALILAILFIHKDEHASLTGFFDDLFGRGDGAGEFAGHGERPLFLCAAIA